MRFEIRMLQPPNTSASSCRIEVSLNNKLLLDEPCSSSVAVVVAMADSDGWHQLEVAVLQPFYASVRIPGILTSLWC